MEFFRIRRDIPFMRHALVFNVISLVTFLLAVVFLATRGLNFGVDFRGGTTSTGYAARSTSCRSANTRRKRSEARTRR
jgi:preprotein translocase subunit SecF